MKLRLLWTLLMALALSCPLVISASAQDHDRDDQNRHVDQDRDHDRDHDRWEHRKDWDYRTYDRDRRPEGWNEGQRTEWRNCETGDGHRYDCYTYSYNNTPYYYYRDDSGRLIVRRRHHDKDRDDYMRDGDHDRDDKH